MTTAASAARRQQRLDDLCGAAVRALTDDASLHYRGGRLYAGDAAFPARAGHLRAVARVDDTRSFRGAADGLALRRRHSDPVQHRAHFAVLPNHPAALLVFELLEQFRVEALAALPGMVANLRHRHTTWTQAFHESGLADTHQGLLLLTLAQVCRSRVTAQPVVSSVEDLIEATRFGLVPVIGGDLAALRRTREDQTAYAAPAAAIAATVAGLLEAASSTDDRDEDDDDSTLVAFTLLLDSPEESDPLPVAESGRSQVLVDGVDGYRVFTRAHDRVRTAHELVRPELLAGLRRRLDRLVAEQGVNVPRLARVLQQQLARPERAGFDDGQEEGLIDGRRLAGLVARPDERRIFRTERREPHTDTAVTFLVDCSGSMRRHHEPLATVLDIMVRSLELADATTEVLGFTTGAWNGGRALGDWRRAGRPRHPGRLNEVLHLVIKDAGQPWRRQRAGLAALLKDDLYREGVDGEAVAWACARLRQSPEERRVLVVVSDGSPRDAATALANDRHYLDHHLRDVVRRESRQGGVRIVGLGVGLDLSPYFGECHALDLEAPGNQVYAELAAVLGGRDRRRITS